MYFNRMEEVSDGERWRGVGRGKDGLEGGREE